MGFIWSQLFIKPAYPTTDFSGQTVIVTGSNVGLGREAARHFARLNAKKIILAVRNTTAGEEAKQDIEKSTKRPGVCEVWKLDLSNYSSVKSFAEKAIKELERIDVLLENAGIATTNFRKAEENESTITVNVVSTFLLALLLLPKLQETGTKFQTRPRLVIVSSEVHAWAKFTERNESNILDALSDENKAKMDDRYQASKLLEVLTIRQIAPMISKSKNSSVILNTLNPGLCHSSLSRDMDTFVFWAFKTLLARTTEVGSRTLVAAAGAGEDTHGKYMSDSQVDEKMVASWVKTAEGDKVGAQVWKELSAKLETISPGVTESLQ